MSRFKMSDLSDTQIKQMIYNDTERTIDVSIANNLIPPRYDYVEYEYITSPYAEEVKFVNFYGNGTGEITDVRFTENVTGTKQEFTFDFLGQTSGSVDGKYFILYDTNGSVGVWYNVDNLTIPPVTGADRDIEINIASGDSGGAITSKTQVALDLDSEFNASVNLTFFLTVQNEIPKDISDPNSGTTSLLVTQVNQGSDSINSKSFKIQARSDETLYVWFNLDGNGVDPSYPLETGIEVPFTYTDTDQQVLEKLNNELNNNYLLISEIIEDRIRISNKYLDSGKITDIDTNFYISTFKEGKSNYLVGQVEVIFNPDWTIKQIIRLI